MTEAESAESGAAEQLQLSDVSIAAVGWLREFEAERGEATAVINYLGNARVRIVAIAADGTFGDAVVPSVAEAEEVCQRAGVDVGSWDRETSAKVAISPADRRKMAGTGR